MEELTQIGLVDLIVGVVVVVAVAGALKDRRGLLGAVGAAIGSLLLAWLVVVAVVTWGPQTAAVAARDSAFAQTFPVPSRALSDLDGVDGPDRSRGPGASGVAPRG